MAGNEDSVNHNGPPEDEPLGRVGPTSDNAATVARPADNHKTDSVKVESDAIPLMRVPISLPCQVPVVPGTPRVDAPIEERTERCAIDAFWMVGRAMVCSLHLRHVLPIQWHEIVSDVPLDELRPWGEMHRYAQELATPEWDKP